MNPIIRFLLCHIGMGVKHIAAKLSKIAGKTFPHEIVQPFVIDNPVVRFLEGSCFHIPMSGGKTLDLSDKIWKFSVPDYGGVEP